MPPPETPDFDEFLAEAGPAPAHRRKRCMTCNRLPELAALTLEFFDRKAAGTMNMTFLYFYEAHVQRKFDISWSALRNHVVRCLRRDITTGRPL